MEKIVYPGHSLEARQEKYQTDIALAESTEGYQKLTPRQQQIIRVSLQIQARAERDMHPDHKNDPWYFDWFKREKKYHPGYQKSLEHIKKWYCHAAVASLESGSLSGNNPPEHPKDFFDAAYFMVRTEYELERAIQFFGFPAVVHANTENENYQGEETQYHTFLALGRDRDNEIVVWEKAGFKYPYRIAKLSEVYEEYAGIPFWGIRKLR